MEDASTCYRTKFFAYSVNASGILTKRYIYPPFGAHTPGDGETELNEGQLHALSLALESPCLAALDTKRFSLYEISFRGEDGAKAVSFNFIDTRDREYLSAAEVFSTVRGFDVTPLIQATGSLDHSVFPSGTDYNPNWMFGLLFERDSLVSVKAYMRFDVERALGPEGRLAVISRIMKAHSAPERLENDLRDRARLLESSGFFLRILGIDQKNSGDLRYKFYFRSDGSEEPDRAMEMLLETVEDQDTKTSIERMFRRHSSGMWGIGISVGALSEIEGYQPYFYPKPE